ncbi:MAG: cytochrome C [Proteobacteria bacterium]|nr:MAG: cytochrome C [Pseudomonadota bacterium]
MGKLPNENVWPSARRLVPMLKHFSLRSGRICHRAIAVAHRSVRAVAPFAMIALASASTGATDVDAIAALKPDFENGLYVFQLCADCHTPQGWGLVDGSVPMLSGQHRRVLIKQLADIRQGQRHNDAMFSFAQDDAVGGEQSIADVSDYISKLLMHPSPGVGPGFDLERAEVLYAENCASCHGPNGEGDDRLLYPRVQGQHFGYLVRQMNHMVNGKRRNSDPRMVEALRRVTPVERELLADFMARTPPDPALVAPPDWENPDFNFGIQ